MGGVRLHGDGIANEDVADRKVAANPTPRQAQPEIQLDRFFRNSLHPDAGAMSEMNTAANQCSLLLTKLLFCSPGSLIGLGTAASENRWRMSFRTGAYAHAIRVVACMFPPIDALGVLGSSYGQLRLYSDATETTLVSTTTFTYGPHPSGAAAGTDRWEYIRVIDKLIDLAPDTEYYGLWSNEDYGRAHSILMYELSSLTENSDGYLATNVSSVTPIVDSFRENLVTVVRNLWTKCAAHVLNWSATFQAVPATNATTTLKNIIDDSTGVGGSKPGFVIDLTNCDRLSQTSGVPCVMKVFADVTGGDTGGVFLANSSGAILATVIVAGTAQWSSTTVNIPALQDTYYLMHGTSAGIGTLSTYAVSIWQYG